MRKISIVLITLIILLSISCNEKIIEPDEQRVEILLKYNYKDELNTFEKYFIKDLVIDGLYKVEFWLTELEQTEIEKKTYELNFFTLPDSMLNSAPVEISPNFTHYLKIKIGNDENAVTWNITLPEYQTEEHTKIYKLAKYIIDIIESKPEYKKLPERNGGYD